MFKEAAWVEEQSIKLWGVSVGIDYESWVEYLIKDRNKEEAQMVLDLAIDEFGDDSDWQIYQREISDLPSAS